MNLTLPLLTSFIVFAGFASAGEPIPFANRIDRNAIVEAENLPSTLDEENLLWRRELGGGPFMNSISIVDGRVYCIVSGKAGLSDYTPHHNALLVFDLHTGEVLIDQGYFKLGGGYDAEMPLMDEGRIYTRSGNDFICIDAMTGDVVWKKNPLDDVGIDIQRCHGPNGSGFIIGDYYYMPTCSSGMEWTPRIDELSQEWPWAPLVIVMDKHTGDLVAMDDVEQEHFYHGQWSMLTGGVVDGEQLLFYGDGYGLVHAFKALESYPEPRPNGDVHRLERVWHMDANPEHYRTYPDTGLVRSYKAGWDQVRRLPDDNPNELGITEIIGAPVFKDGLLYVVLARDYEYCNKRGARAFGDGGIMCIDPKGEGDITETNIVWRNLDLNRTFNTPSITDDGLIFISDLSGQLNCFDAKTGEKLWQHDITSKVWNYGQIVADGKVYVQNSTGQFYILKAAREKEVLYEGRLNGRNGPMTGITDGIIVVATGAEIAAYAKPETIEKIRAQSSVVFNLNP